MSEPILVPVSDEWPACIVSVVPSTVNMKKGVRYAALVLVLAALLSGLIPLPSVFGLDSSFQVDDLHDYKPIQPLLPITGSAEKLSLLAARTDLIAYGQVLGLRSYWRDDGLTIESEIRVALKQSYKGAAASEILIRKHD